MPTSRPPPRFSAPLLQILARTPGGLLSPWRSLDLRRLGRVLLHSVLVGVLAGGVACLFFFALEWAEWLVLGKLAHFAGPAARGEVEITPHLPAAPTRFWILAVLPAIGGLACGLLVYFLAPEAAGTGGDAYMDAFHHKRGIIRTRVPAVKALASLLIVSTGGSAGREGPMMQTCAGLGSMLARFLRLNDRERRILVIAGAAAGIGAIFRTPLGAALYAVEVLYRDDFETDAIVPAILASVTGYSIFTTVYGQGHLFATDPSYQFIAAALPLYGVMAVGVSLFGALFVSFRHGMEEKFFAKLSVPPWLLPMIGGLLLGALALLVPQALGTGHGWVQGAIERASWIPQGASGYVLLFGLAATKILATALTIGSRGSGGEFGPSLVIGGLVGGAFGLFFHQVAPELVPQPGAFALVGMGAFFGGIAHVPVSSLIMVCEMAGSYDLLVPLMLAEGITFVLLRGVTLYRKQLPTRLDSPAHREDMTIDVLESLRVSEIYEKDVMFSSVKSDTPLKEVLHVMAEAELPGVLVRNPKGQIVGLISLESVQGGIAEEGLDDLAVAADVMTEPAVLELEDNLHTALHEFLISGMSVLPVVDAGMDHRPIVGVLTHDDVTRAYDDAAELRPDASA